MVSNACWETARYGLTVVGYNPERVALYFQSQTGERLEISLSHDEALALAKTLRDTVAAAKK